MGEKASTETMSSRKKLLKVKIEDNSKRSVVVFDIDDTLCKLKYHLEKEFLKKHLPECPIIECPYKEFIIHDYIFLPYLHILFDYLLNQGTRIAFFSFAPKERNVTLLSELLISFWGKKKYETLKSRGQFDIFSAGDVVRGHYIGEEDDYVKNLKVVIQDTESLLDAILVEDCTRSGAYDQQPCMYIINLLYWHLPCTDQEEEGSYCKNSTYYMLGLFKTYFEEGEYKKLPLRVCMDQIIPRDEKQKLEFFEEHPFALKMIHIGLREVQKTAPDAILYKSEKKRESSLSREESGDGISKETRYESFIRNLSIGNIPLSMYYLAEYLFERFQSSHITGGNHPVEFYQDCILNLIKTLKETKNLSIEVGPKTHDVWVIPTNTHKRRPCITLLSFVYDPNEEELENTAKTVLQGVQPQVDLKKSPNATKLSAGVAFSAKSLVAAYEVNCYDKKDKQTCVTDIYTR